MDQEGESEYFYYDHEGNLIETIDRNQNRVITSYTMDGNILLQKAVKADGSGEIMNRYDYDTLGRIKRAISGNLSYTYDGNRNRIGKDGFLWNGENPPKQESIRFLYDQKNQLVAKRGEDNSYFFTYDQQGSLTGETTGADARQHL